MNGASSKGLETPKPYGKKLRSHVSAEGRDKDGGQPSYATLALEPAQRR